MSVAPSVLGGDYGGKAAVVTGGTQGIDTGMSPLTKNATSSLRQHRIRVNAIAGAPP